MGRRKLSKQPDETLAKGTITAYIAPSMIDASEYHPGDKVDIATYCQTPAGFSYRIKNTIRWVDEKYIDIGKFATEIKNRFRTNTTRDTNKSRGQQRPPVKTKTGKAGEVKMDKQELKSTIRQLTQGDRVTVSFLSSIPSSVGTVSGLAGQTQEYTVTETKRGRGKGGSQLMELKADDGSTLTVGTPHSDYILSVTTPDGQLHGYEDESQVPKIFEKDAGKAAELRSTAVQLLTAEDPTYVNIDASVPEFTGRFLVQNVKRLKGRFGQLSLTLQAEDGSTTELWTYRHSGVIRQLTVE